MTYLSKATVAPGGEVEVEPGEGGDSVYGPIEVAWYPDRVTITAVGAGRDSRLDEHLERQGQDVVVEIRLPSVDELADRVPGAD